MFTVLHISDLHRSPDEPVSNDELVSSLVADRDHYMVEEPSVRAPQAIIVSGDLIHGAPPGHPDPAAEIETQYEAALRFLEELTDRFLDGDRSKVVIVPGNHDVDWNASMAAVREVPDERIPENLWNELTRPGTHLRWDWRTRKVLEVTDQASYESRFEAYWNFVDRFYESEVDHQREDYFTLHELCDGRIGVVAFNSCWGNDRFSLQGSIPYSALSRAHLALHDKSSGYELLMAVWHHAIQGPPLRTDYMDIETVDLLVGKGFRVGLHGHQHRAEAVARSINLPGGEAMAVISSGSLCAGSPELPRGVDRQYNVITFGDDLCSCTVHVREMRVPNVFGPAHLHMFGGASNYEMTWTPPAPLVAGGRPEEARIADRVIAAEEALRMGNAAEAAESLREELHTLPPHGRKVLLRAVTELNEPEQVIELFLEPVDLEELVAFVGACIDVQDFARARDALDQYSDKLELPDPQQEELRQRIYAQETISHGS